MSLSRLPGLLLASHAPGRCAQAWVEDAKVIFLALESSMLESIALSMVINTDDMKHIVTEDWINSFKTSQGGLTRNQLAWLGVKWL